MTRAVLPMHGRFEHRPNGPDPIPASYEIKVFADDEDVVTGDGAFVFCIPADVGGTRLREAQAFVTTAGSGVTRVQIRNVTTAADMLLPSFRIEIDSGELTTYGAADLPQVDDTGTPPNNLVSTGDLIAVDVDAVGSGAMGLGVMLKFGPNIIRLTP